MERAAKLLRGPKFAQANLTPEQVGVAAWPVAVGRKVARHTRAVNMVRGRLVVEVPDDIWQNQLRTLRRQILNRIARDLGPELVTDIEFRVVPPRMGPGREMSIVRGALWDARPVSGSDDADDIDDPILSRIYKAQRARRAQAAPGASPLETKPKRSTA